MTQVTIDTEPTVVKQPPKPPVYPQQQEATAPGPTNAASSGATSAASNNLTWAIGIVLIIAAIAIAVVYVFHNVHP